MGWDAGLVIDEMYDTKKKLLKDACKFAKDKFNTEQLEKWFGYVPEDINDRDYDFIITHPKEWDYFWILFGDICLNK